MLNHTRRPILVTGSHRSGSTWIGKMLALSRQIGYIWEPFNILNRPGLCAAQFDNWFTYINNSNGIRYEKAIRDCISFKYNIPAELKAIKSFKDISRLMRDLSIFTLNKTLRKRPLAKDPIAFFSAEWLSKTLDMQVVIIMRHPAAFAGSLKKTKWEFPFSHFLSQPMFMEEKLMKFKSEIEMFSKSNRDIIDQACLLWKIFATITLEYKSGHPEWIFVRHEDLSNDPIQEFRALYQKLSIKYNYLIEKKIRWYTGSHNPKEQHKPGSVRRDSYRNKQSWKNRLTAIEILRIRELTDYVSSKFYSEGEW